MPMRMIPGAPGIGRLVLNAQPQRDALTCEWRQALDQPEKLGREFRIVLNLVA